MTPDASAQRPIDRAALERVLARAAELQARAGDDDAGLSEAQVIDLATDVGLSVDAVRQAVAEERARLPMGHDRGFAASALGEAAVEAGRTLSGDAAALLARLDAWMQQGESLQVMRRFPDQLAWEARQDFVAMVRRALRVGGRPFALASATEVRALVANAGAGRAHVRLVADFRGTRRQRATGALVVATVGVVIGVPLFVMAVNAGLAIAAALSLVPALALPVGGMAVARRQFAALRARGEVSLEQALDRLECGDGGRGRLTP